MVIVLIIAQLKNKIKCYISTSIQVSSQYCVILLKEDAENIGILAY